MNIPEKLDKKNFGKYKNSKTLILEMTDWLQCNTNINTESLSKMEMVFLIRNGYTENPTCVCGNPITFQYSKYRTYCSPKCSATTESTKNKRRCTTNQKYGCDNVFQNTTIKQQVKKTNLERYGDENPFRLGSEYIRNKIMERYGVEYISQSSEIKQKIQDTCMERYGVSHPMKQHTLVSEISRKRYDNTYESFDRFSLDVVPLFITSEYHGGGYDILYKWMCKKCNQEFDHWYHNGYVPKCTHCYGKSAFELEVYDYIKSLGIDVQRNKRTIIKNMELDLYIPTKNIAIECNGNYWHSEIGGGKDSTYHVLKTNKCTEQGIRLIHIFQDEWKYKKEIVQSRLNHIFGLSMNKVYARKCVVKKIDTITKNVFLDKYHIQGKDNTPIRYGLFHDDILVAVMTFSRRRFDNKIGYELVRYATHSDYSVVGGAGKLLKAFESEFTPKSIISYADRRWSIGSLYLTLGFTHTHTSSPSYFYTKKYDIRESRIKYQKHNQKKLLNTFDSKLTEWENMQKNGFDRIWDCGNMVFEKTYGD